MADKETLGVYDTKVADYVNMTERSEIDPDLKRFMAYLPKGAFVLDLGCGPAASAVVMRDQGLVPDPVDASAEMVRFANETHAINARVATFDDIEGEAVYDGIWANFSLLHAPRSAMAGHLQALRRALKPDGIFHIGMKLGEGEERDKLGRFYTYYSDNDLTVLLEAEGFSALDRTFGQGGGLSGRVEPWVTILARAVV